MQLLVVHEFYGERMTQGACKALQVLRLHIHGDFPIGRGLERGGQGLVVRTGFQRKKRIYRI